MKSTKTWSWTRTVNTLRFENYQPRKQRQEKYTHSENETKVRGRERGREGGRGGGTEGGRKGDREEVFRISLTRMKRELDRKAGSHEPSTAVRSVWTRKTLDNTNPGKSSKRGGDPEGTKPLQPRAQGTPPNVCPPLAPTPSTRWPPAQGAACETAQASPETSGKRSFFECWSRHVPLN